MYKASTLEKKALKEITARNLVFISEVVSYLPCSSSTFYSLELEKSEAIKEALENNRIEQKAKMRNKWYESDNATLQVAAYKLIGTDEEAERLGNTRQKMEHSGPDGKPIETVSTLVIQGVPGDSDGAYN